MHSPHSENNAE